MRGKTNSVTAPKQQDTPRASEVAKNGAWAMGGRMAMLIAGLALNVLLAKLLDPSQLGEYFLIISMATLSATVARLGSAEAMVRLVAERPNSAAHVVRLGCRLFALGIAIVAVVTIIGGFDYLIDDLFEITLSLIHI